MRPFSQFLFMLVAALTCFSTGCATSTAVWLPDSSGFLYLDENDQPGDVLHYNLTRKTTQRFKAGGIISSNLDVSADGKKIACLLREKEDAVEGSLVVFDLAGKQLHRSKAFKFPEVKRDGKSETPRFEGLLEWFPQGDRLLIQNMVRDEDLAHTTYRPEAAKLEPFEQGNPLLALRWMSSCPQVIRPDGKGYYFMVKDSVFFKDFENGTKQCDISAIKKALGQQDFGGNAHYSWNHNQLVVSVFGIPIAKSDLEKGTITLNPEGIQKVKQAQVDHPGLIDRIFFANQETALLLSEEKLDDKKTLCKIELAGLKDQKTKRLLTSTNDRPQIRQSPDLKYVTVFLKTEKGEGQRYVVIDAQGRLLEELVLTARKKPNGK